MSAAFSLDAATVAKIARIQDAMRVLDDAVADLHGGNYRAVLDPVTVRVENYGGTEAFTITRRDLRGPQR